jgi:hypothetical protein
MRRFAAQGPGGAASPQGLMAVTDRQGGTREPPRHYAWSSYAGLTRALCADKFAHFDTKKFGAHDVAAQRPFLSLHHVGSPRASATSTWA